MLFYDDTQLLVTEAAMEALPAEYREQLAGLKKPDAWYGGDRTPNYEDDDKHFFGDE